MDQIVNILGTRYIVADELLVQWLAKQFPKMMDVMREVGSI